MAIGKYRFFTTVIPHPWYSNVLRKTKILNISYLPVLTCVLSFQKNHLNHVKGSFEYPKNMFLLRNF